MVLLVQVCLHCLGRVAVPLACPTCCRVVFCSENCREAACSSYHLYQCQLNLQVILVLLR